MNDDPSPSLPPRDTPMQPWIEPELEARIVAWIAGEASAFEAAELERLCAEKPELALFKARIAAAHALVGEAVQPDREPLQLDPARRARLLATLQAQDTESAAPSASEPIAAEEKKIVPFGARFWSRARMGRWLALGAAACVPLIGLLAFLTVDKISEPEEQMQMSKDARRFELVAGTERDAAEKATREHADLTLAKRRAPTESVVRMEMPPPTPPEGETRSTTALAADEAQKAAAEEPIPQAARREPPAPALDLAPARLATGSTTPSVSTAEPASNVPLKIEYPKPLFVGTPRPIVLAPSEPFTGTQTLRNEAATDTYGSFANRGPVGNAGNIAPQMGPIANAPGTLATSDLTRAKERSDSLELGTVAIAVDGTITSSTAPAPAAAAGNANQAPAGPLTLQAFSVAPPPAAGGAPGSSEVIKLDAFTISADKKARAAAPAAKVARASGTRPAANDDPAPPPRPAVPLPPLDETEAAREPVSTFSLHVSDVSFRLAHAAFARGELPDPARIRPEEFYNAFDYGDPLPALAERVGCRIEQAAHPFLQQRNLLRLAVRVPATGRAAAQPLRLTVLLDTSGSMEREDRRAAVRAAFKSLLALLGPADRITLIGFARQPRLLAEDVAGPQAARLLEIIERTPAEGGTNLEAALALGQELARRHRLPSAQNRIVLLTDGAANLGDADPERLGQTIETLRAERIAFDACGVGLDGLDDAVLEALTRRGDGRYYALNGATDADAAFARQIAGALRPAAENVKLQVRFNPARVGHYRLIGFDRHRLRTEDFRNDRVDAAELAAEEAAVALYQVETLPQGTGEIGEVAVRFRDAATGTMVENTWTISYDAQPSAFDRASSSLQLAGTAALLAEKLRGGPPAAAIKLRDLAGVATGLRSRYAGNPRVEDLVFMYQQARRLLPE